MPKRKNPQSKLEDEPKNQSVRQEKDQDSVYVPTIKQYFDDLHYATGIDKTELLKDPKLKINLYDSRIRKPETISTSNSKFYKSTHSNTQDFFNLTKNDFNEKRCSDRTSKVAGYVQTGRWRYRQFIDKKIIDNVLPH